MFGFWNVRGLNDPIKIREVRRLINANDLCLVGLFETRVRETNRLKVQRALLSHWKFYAATAANTSGRIWLCWDPSRCTVDILDVAEQWIHCAVQFVKPAVGMRISFVYGSNDAITRRQLWKFITTTAAVSTFLPWCIRGDLNTVRWC